MLALSFQNFYFRRLVYKHQIISRSLKSDLIGKMCLVKNNAFIKRLIHQFSSCRSEHIESLLKRERNKAARSLCCILPESVGKSHRRKPKSCICVHLILEITSAKKGVILCQPYQHCLQGGLLITGPPGKSLVNVIFNLSFFVY